VSGARAGMGAEIANEVGASADVVGEPGASVEPYLRLAELAEAELVACQEERPEDLAPYYEEAQRIIQMLPPRPPASAAEALHRAAGAQRQIEGLLANRLAIADGDLDHLRRGREAARAYATTAAAIAR
jgi:5,10-methenyltetrahydromethanopterin hydrogenase